MKGIVEMTDSFWKWAGYNFSWKEHDISDLALDPLCFPEFEELQKLCISLINNHLSDEELYAFLMCMALDFEDECILDACKERANTGFLCDLLSKGVSFPQIEARWQMAELLRKDMPNRQAYLNMLLHDSNSYVRKRANNVASEII